MPRARATSCTLSNCWPDGSRRRSESTRSGALPSCALATSASLSAGHTSLPRASASAARRSTSPVEVPGEVAGWCGSVMSASSLGLGGGVVGVAEDRGDRDVTGHKKTGDDDDAGRARKGGGEQRPLGRDDGAVGAQGVHVVLVDAELERRVADDQRVAGVLLVGEDQGLDLALRSEEHTSELQSRQYLVCRLLL